MKVFINFGTVYDVKSETKKQANKIFLRDLFLILLAVFFLSNIHANVCILYRG
jgi:hypothetical protein